MVGGTSGHNRVDEGCFYPATRTVEVFTLTGSGAWLLTDQTNLGTLTLASIDCKLPMEWVFKGMERDSA